MKNSAEKIDIGNNLSKRPVHDASVLVTGGAGFIGSNFIRYMLGQPEFTGRIINYDKLTYAGNPLNLLDMEQKFGGKRYFFERGDICDYARVNTVLEQYNVSVIVHFAAESHVDRSIFGPKDFIDTNINGTFNLLEAARRFWGTRKDVRFHHISTDEVYGSLGEDGYFLETTPYDPRSPYSASKASSDHLVRAYFHTYGLQATISNCSNNYGPYHFPEKLIPLVILNAVEGKPLPVYGDGKNIRDWLYVEDHCSAIWLILQRGRTGETYNIGGECEKTNIDVVHTICSILDEAYPVHANTSMQHRSNPVTCYRDLIAFVPDRPGHDRRYAIDCSKIKRELQWQQRYNFHDGLKSTVLWYLNNREWVNSVRTGEYARWIEKNYGKRQHGA